MSRSIVVSAMVHTGDNIGRMLHMSLEKTYAGCRHLPAGDCLSKPLFLIVNLGVIWPLVSQAITTHPRLLCMPALSTRVGLSD